MSAAGIAALKKLPLAACPQREMGVFQNAEIAEERIESQTGVKHFAPPDGAGGRHEIDSAHAAERRLQVGIDRIAALIVVLARLVCRQQIQLPIPPPALRLSARKVLVRPVPYYSSRIFLFLEDSRHSPQKIRLKPDIVIYQRDKLA
jgi:hypothetical protein